MIRRPFINGKGLSNMTIIPSAAMVARIVDDLISDIMGGVARGYNTPLPSVARLDKYCGDIYTRNLFYDLTSSN